MPTLEKLRAERAQYMRWTAQRAEVEKLERFAAAYRGYRAQVSIRCVRSSGCREVRYPLHPASLRQREGGTFC